MQVRVCFAVTELRHLRKQETQLSLTNRATHLRKCNDVADLTSVIKIRLKTNDSSQPAFQGHLRSLEQWLSSYVIVLLTYCSPVDVCIGADFQQMWTTGAATWTQLRPWHLAAEAHECLQLLPPRSTLSVCIGPPRNVCNNNKLIIIIIIIPGRYL